VVRIKHFLIKGLMPHNLYETPDRKTASPEIWVKFADFQADANHGGASANRPDHFEDS